MSLQNDFNLVSCGVSFQLYISAPSELHHLEPSCAAPPTKNVNFECGNLDLTAAGFFSPHVFPIFSRSRKLRRFPDPIIFFVVVISQRLEKNKQIASYKLMQVG